MEAGCVVELGVVVVAAAALVPVQLRTWPAGVVVEVLGVGAMVAVVRAVAVLVEVEVVVVLGLVVVVRRALAVQLASRGANRGWPGGRPSSESKAAPRRCHS